MSVHSEVTVTAHFISASCDLTFDLSTSGGRTVSRTMRQTDRESRIIIWNT